MQSVDRLVQVINLLGTKTEGFPITEISKKVNLSGSTVHRILSALKTHGVIYQDPLTKRYHLGLTVLTWGKHLINSNHIEQAAHDPIRELNSQFKVCVFLSIFENGKIVCIDSVEKIKGNLNFFVKVGSIMPLNAAAASQAILAFQSQKLIEDQIEHEEIHSYTAKTITSITELRNKIEQVRKEGHAICDEELEQGVIAVSVPVFNLTQTAIASITICDIKKTDINFKEYLEPLKNAALIISNKLRNS